VRYAEGLDNMLVASPQSDAVATVRHRYAPARPLADEGVQLAESCLSTRELAELDTWHNAERRRNWLQGRILTKQLIAANVNRDLPIAEIEILSRTHSSRPCIWCGGQEQSWSFSISHTDRGVLAALCFDPNTSVGVDLTACQPFRDSFIRLWFTVAEIDWLRSTKSPALPAFLWAAKEALFKACNQGESFDPRQVEVLPEGSCRYRGVELENVRLRSWTIDQQIAVLVTVSQFETTIN
jgi:phosphopantetheinyl transferase